MTLECVFIFIIKSQIRDNQYSQALSVEILYSFHQMYSAQAHKTPWNTLAASLHIDLHAVMATRGQKFVAGYLYITWGLANDQMSI